MKYGQHNFVVTIPAKAESLTARMDEAFQVKMALARHFLDTERHFAIVSEDIVSNEKRVSSRFNLIISIVPQAEGVIPLLNEGLALQKEMADVIKDIGYSYIIADEDMMSEVAKDKIQYLPKENGEWIV